MHIFVNVLSKLFSYSDRIQSGESQVHSSYFTVRAFSGSKDRR